VRTPQDFHDTLRAQFPWLAEHPGATRLAVILAVVVIAVAADWAVKRILVRAVGAMAARTTTTWDDAILRHKVLHRIAQLVPAILLSIVAPLIFPGEDEAAWAEWTQRLAEIWMTVVVLRSLQALLDAAIWKMQAKPSLHDQPLRSYAQVLMILAWLAGGVLLVSRLLGQSPWGVLTGLGALTAVMLLVFKDSILGLVASLQIAADDKVRRGDWVEHPKYGADGEVEDISLHTVKVRNWDKTLVMVPTTAFITDGFKNWRGMQESGARRIKRAVALDVGSVRFLGERELARLRRVQRLAKYLDEKSAELATWNRAQGVDESSPVNGRRLTNLGTFRAYLTVYLREHPKLRKDMTLMVRQLPPGPDGLPLEIYAFSAEQEWAAYEDIIGDLFDHVLAVIPEFGLRAFQRPTGADLREAGAHAAAAAVAAEPS
jgi:miniconductance mechanosensitive channel